MRSIRLSIFFVVLVLSSLAMPSWGDLPDADPSHLPRWRGFNLLAKFHFSTAKPFQEWDFQHISAWGFNFVRLPMDYRCWIQHHDWKQPDESLLTDIDQAVAWGRKYGIHVSLNFHRAPGYSVNHYPKEPTDLWTDPVSQEICARHWAMFARHYRGVPNRNLSFDLINEPAGTDAETYDRVVRQLVSAIRAEDPNRLIIVEGLKDNPRSLRDLADLHVAGSTHGGYTPITLTHYQAPWVDGANRFGLPTWPERGLPGYLYGPSKPELSAPLVLKIPSSDQPITLRIHVAKVSDRAHLIVTSDRGTVLDKYFRCGPGEGEWKQSVYRPQYKIYQNVFDRDYTAEIKPGAQQISLSVVEGDWMSLSALSLTFNDREKDFPMVDEYGRRQLPAALSEAPVLNDRQTLWTKTIEPWKALEAIGMGIHVGEWGAWHNTPHDVVLRWMQDSLENWRQANMGWALWEFRGGFGVLDSGRKDVQYESFEGHQLDRQMLELLQRY